jgi:hypothetical protein
LPALSFTRELFTGVLSVCLRVGVFRTDWGVRFNCSSSPHLAEHVMQYFGKGPVAFMPTISMLNPVELSAACLLSLAEYNTSPLMYVSM